jgi:hypothetical protein
MSAFDVVKLNRTWMRLVRSYLRETAIGPSCRLA